MPRKESGTQDLIVSPYFISPRARQLKNASLDAEHAAYSFRDLRACMQQHYADMHAFVHDRVDNPEEYQVQARKRKRRKKEKRRRRKKEERKEVDGLT